MKNFHPNYLIISFYKEKTKIINFSQIHFKIIKFIDYLCKKFCFDEN